MSLVLFKFSALDRKYSQDRAVDMYHLNQRRWSFAWKLVIMIRIENYGKELISSRMKCIIELEEFLFDGNKFTVSLLVR